jgi:hypothetical protein
MECRRSQARVRHNGRRLARSWILRDELDGYTVTFTTLAEDIDATPFMRGLPDDRCPCPTIGAT